MVSKYQAYKIPNNNCPYQSKEKKISKYEDTNWNAFSHPKIILTAIIAWGVAIFCYQFEAFSLRQSTFILLILESNLNKSFKTFIGYGLSSAIIGPIFLSLGIFLFTLSLSLMLVYSTIYFKKVYTVEFKKSYGLRNK